jgi:hypothetical protein
LFSLLNGTVVKVEEQRGLLEAAVHFTESTFKAVWDNNILEQPAKLQGACLQACRAAWWIA